MSRTYLYELKNQAEPALIHTLDPKSPGPKPKAEDLIVLDDAFIRRTITRLPMVKSSIRGIQSAFYLLYGVHRSIRYIDQTLQQMGEAAMEINHSLSIPLPVLAEADEILAANPPCLSVVDRRSGMVLALSAQEKRDAVTWGVTFLSLDAQGIEFVDVVSDGAGGIRFGVAIAELGVPLRFSLFHLMPDAHQVTKRLERQAYRAIETAERGRRAKEEADAQRRRRGRPLVVKVPLLADSDADSSMAKSSFCWIFIP